MKTALRVAAVSRLVQSDAGMSVDDMAGMLGMSGKSLRRRFRDGDLWLSEFERLCYLCNVSDVDVYRQPQRPPQCTGTAITIRRRLFSDGEQD
jgi:hypothetical protein